MEALKTTLRPDQVSDHLLIEKTIIPRMKLHDHTSQEQKTKRYIGVPNAS